jgi:hypothetical protein
MSEVQLSTFRYFIFVNILFRKFFAERVQCDKERLLAPHAYLICCPSNYCRGEPIRAVALSLGSLARCITGDVDKCSKAFPILFASFMRRTLRNHGGRSRKYESLAADICQETKEGRR